MINKKGKSPASQRGIVVHGGRNGHGAGTASGTEGRTGKKEYFE